MPLTKSHVLSLFTHLTANQPATFFAHVVDNVDWHVTGESHALAGHWHSKESFFRDSWMSVGPVLLRPMELSVEGVIAEADGRGLEGRACVEMRGKGVLGDGREYNNEYCWVVSFNEEGLITKVRAYLDTARLQNALKRND
ncbi:hypothetical protein CC78DRAFT_570903 [Lojkania enalia]|uniref:SnoaL-like domain-containing protein n=1 Tax=Lojkania enalia TaxID=147567 RepID=A0A9P4MX40_9PLEO|nr:hypothetical protein CC78DRAFT_570903 [Didymosphaeria enalia]